MTHSNKSRWQIAYNNQAAPDHLAGGFREFNGYRLPRTYVLLQHSIQRATATWRGQVILDAGCGSGDTGSFLTTHNTVTGVDFSHQMAFYAHQRHYPQTGVADVEHLPFRDQVFDGLLAVGVWQCLPPQSAFLSEAARVVRVGGEVVFGWVLNADYLLYRRGVHFRLDPEVELRLLDVPTMHHELAVAGLDVIEWYGVVFPFGVVRWQTVPRWASPFMPALTVRCRVMPS